MAAWTNTRASAISDSLKNHQWEELQTQQRDAVTRKANVLEHDLKYGKIPVHSGVYPASFSPSCRN